MRKMYMAAIAATTLAGAAQAQVVTDWVLTGEPGNQAFTAGSGMPASVTDLPMTRGSGINPSAAADTFSGTNWHTLAPDDYFSFGFIVEPGWDVLLGELRIGTRSSNSGPGSLGLFYSGDGFSTNHFTFVQNGGTVTNSIVDLSGLGLVSGTVEFRIRSLGDVSAGGGTVGAAGTFRLSDYVGDSSSPVRITGAVVPAGSFATPFCSGDASAGMCPCGNFTSVNQGCANTTGQGAQLTASGTPSVAAADLVLSTLNLSPGTLGVYYQGNQLLNGGSGLPFGDGLRCAGGDVVRIDLVVTGPMGESSTSSDIVSRGSITPGQTRYYQLWYHDIATSLCGTGVNLSQGLGITWVP